MRRLFSAVLLASCCFASALLPTALHAQSSASAPATHTVVQGETLWGLAQRYFGRPLLWPDIQQRNNVVEPRLLQIGRVLAFADSERLAWVVAANGDVRATYEGASGLLRTGMRLPEGALLTTGADSFVTLRLPDGSRTTLPSNSTVRLIQFFDPSGRPSVLIDLQAGDIEARVPPRHPSSALPEQPSQTPSFAQEVFRVRTRMATVGVRGTHFRVSMPAADLTAVSVLESTVSVDTGDGAPALISAKKGLLVGAARSPDAVRDLLAAPSWVDAGQPQNQPGVVLAWMPVPGAVGYRVNLARDAEFADLVAQQNVTANGDRALAVFDGVGPGSYFARVAGVTPEGLEGLTAIESFSRSQAALAGTVQRRDGADEIEFEWEPIADSSYLLEVADDAAFEHTVVHAERLQSNRVRVQALPPGVYFWRVRASVITQGQRAEVLGPTSQLRVDGVR